MWVFSLILSFIMDKLCKDGIIDQTTARKICTGISSFLPAICLIAVVFSGCNRPAAVALMTVAVMFVSGMYCGYLTNHVDIAPNYAGKGQFVTFFVKTIRRDSVCVQKGEWDFQKCLLNLGKIRDWKFTLLLFWRLWKSLSIKMLLIRPPHLS